MLLATTILCAVLAALLVRRYDLHEREPWWMLLLAGALGVGCMWAIGFVEDFTLDRYGPAPRPEWFVATVAATHEEAIRLLAVALIALVLPSQLNDPIDGLIYGSVVGLGMALDESMFFAELWGNDGILPAPTELVRFAGHLVMGGITGFGIGMARLRMRAWLPTTAGCVAFSMLLHFLWDWIAFASQRHERSSVHTMAAVAVMLVGMLAYGALIVVAEPWSRRLFAPDSTKRLSRWGRR